MSRLRVPSATLIEEPTARTPSAVVAGSPGERLRQGNGARETQAMAYVICTNPRSGSWLLAEGLASTGIAGNPREWFNSLEEQRQHSLAPAITPSSQPYLDHVLDIGSTPNGVFGLKLHYYQFLELPSKWGAIPALAGLAASQMLSAVLPQAKYVWLTRRDKARQACSYYRASQTKQWWLIDDPARRRRAAAAPEPGFDARAIAGFEQLLVQNDEGWRRYFSDNGLDPLIIEYEALAGDYAGQIARTLRWLGLPNADRAVIAAPRLKRQSDDQTEAWLTAYRSSKCAAPGPAVPEEPQSPIEAPSFELQRDSKVIPDAWKTWIGSNKLAKAPDAAIVEVLARNGFERNLAELEVTRAGSDPYLLAGEQSQQRFAKARSLSAALQRVAALAPRPVAVERRDGVSRGEFLERYYAANRPVILQGLMREWPALSRWTPDYLKQALQGVEIEIMAGREADADFERNCQAHRARVPFADYVDMVYNGGVTNDYYLVANNAFFQQPGVRPLTDDFSPFPDYLQPTVDNRVFLWFGPAGTETRLHHDNCNILMAQVSGRKHVKLIPADQWPFVYNRVGVFSDVDCENPDLSRWPEFRNATVIDVVLEPGEVLFMPVGWWHHVRTLDPSIMISFTNFVFPNSFGL
jgi:LPS sulfotransferase NodH